MSTCTYSATMANAERAAAFINEQLQTPGVAPADADAMAQTVRQLFATIAEVDHSEGPVLLNVENTWKGICVQMMHAGPLFNPCPTDHNDPIHRQMDEISFEFKYGRNVLSVFRAKGRH